MRKDSAQMPQARQPAIDGNARQQSQSQSQQPDWDRSKSVDFAKEPVAEVARAMDAKKVNYTLAQSKELQTQSSGEVLLVNGSSSQLSHKNKVTVGEKAAAKRTTKKSVVVHLVKHDGPAADQGHPVESEPHEGHVQPNSQRNHGVRDINPTIRGKAFSGPVDN